MGEGVEMNKVRLVNIGYRILGIICIIIGIKYIWLQEYVSPTAYGVTGILIGFIALFIKYKGKDSDIK